ncbi:polysaccharide biosynthesis/export family protein [Prosthecobacter vanneervenii]|uniref:Polysaccharide export outer membrane protein n=1 Tax=Prosthecobacter vanneervenii TaxID=48466 RepID=A0A7W8DJ53_9BACT|nr:polysaccharide biosynthesis/export family protein [Prosthecobacter vanneervenii]MBB5031727.1 polysaccharide export outer membrane protein [Prosthecobacter vanneervenii]
MITPRHLPSRKSSGLRGICIMLCCLGGLLSTLPAQQTTAQAYGSQSRAGSSSSPSPYGVTASNLQQRAAAPADYLIREGDMVQISVFDEPDLAAGGKVRNDGTIQCPLIGSVKIQGLSQSAAARLIETEYRKDYLVHPEVNLFVSQYSSQHVTILGQVVRPGSHELPVEKNLTILQVLGLAGGPTRIANLKKVLVKRMVGGQEKIFKVDVNAMASGNETMMFYVHEDDVITVPESFF